MTKQEFISASLPYKLKMKSPYGFRPNWKESTGIVRVVNLTGDLYADIENRTFTDDFIPIVRPLSNLTKEIVQADYNNGEPFVPLVDLAELMYSDISWTGMFKLAGDRVHFDSYESLNEFWYDNESGEFETIFKMGTEDVQYPCNHLKIYQQLLKWHFDLITEDCEKVYVTEDFNPYK